MNVEGLKALAAEMWRLRRDYEDARAAFRLALKNADDDVVDAYHGL